MITIALNGFGRIGRNFIRAIMQDEQAKKKINIAVINVGHGDPKLAAHMFKYDTIMGTYKGSVAMQGENLVIDGMAIKLIAELDPEKIDWRAFGIDWVVDATGAFTTREGASKHLTAGAQHVLITAPAKNEDVSIIPGVNEEKFNKKQHKIVSLGSCTTNAYVPVLKILNDAFTLTQGFMTTVHSYTNSQVLLDVERPDVRRGRSATLNIIPTTTGAAKMVSKIIPELDGLLGATALRVPVAKVSLLDLAFTAKKPLTVDAINNAFKKAADAGPLKDILGISFEPLVSSDYSGDGRSVVVDAELTQVCGSMGKVFGWYDNEWAYSERLKDFLIRVAD
jgi:glyceraldehyde-3-phosphate dehydrogenase type I